MPKYRVEMTDGRVFMVEADSPPSEAEVLQALGTPDTPAVPATPPAAPQGMQSKTGHPLARLGYGLVNYVRENPSAVGAMAGGAAAAPFTGGMSLLPALAAVGGASALGSAGGQALAGQDVSASEAIKQGALGAAGQGIGAGVAGGLKLAGRGLYRAGALPINKLGKYGDLIDEGLKTRTPVSKSGLAKAERIKGARMATKKAAVGAADERLGYRTAGIAEDAQTRLATDAAKRARAAQGDPTELYGSKLAGFVKRNPQATPSSMEEVKGTIDDVLGGTYRKLRMKEPITAKERVNMELSQAISRAQEEAIPGYRTMNRDVMNAEGLRQMIQRRVSPVSSGGNQGLENALMVVGGMKAIPARLAMLPPVISRAGIAANEAGQAAEQSAPTMMRVLLALLGSDGSQQQQPQ